jgi:hypothetical protein
MQTNYQPSTRTIISDVDQTQVSAIRTNHGDHHSHVIDAKCV